MNSSAASDSKAFIDRPKHEDTAEGLSAEFGAWNVGADAVYAAEV